MNQEGKKQAAGNQAVKKQQAVIQNLKDAGCKTEQVEEFLELSRDGNRKRQMLFLEKHRQTLLEEMHEEQKRIDRLDYLVFQMRKSSEKES